ncbi:uncharacterized protein L201_002963 [Kwoniella dendrophila CBS 6074]|uniref:Uncharacterized protein n=1 Tax=Kwoniella dendrophila CBS 6074 TaxID=1295534 RepID=A0AAX4JRM5_9TREE
MATYQPQAQIALVDVFNPVSGSSSTSPIFTRISSPRPKLRSCLSPSRSPSITPYSDSAVATPSGSRSTSFSSCTSGEGWKATKCVRWQEMNGCAVTSTHDTYSHEEYDRTPLEPPSVEERECVLPARGSRCLSMSRDCFLLDEEDYEDDQDLTVESYFLNTPPPTETNSEDGDNQEHIEGNEETAEEEEERKQWEECMERRRQMFARMCPKLHSCGSRSGTGSGTGTPEEDRHPEFEGYRSISATLATLLRSVSNSEAPIEEEDENEQEEENDEEEEEEGITKGDCGFGFSTLNLRSTPLNDNDETEMEIGTPSLISSNDEESEELDDDCIISSPGGLNSNHSTIIPTNNHHHHQYQKDLGTCTEEMVLAAWSTKKPIIPIDRTRRTI